MSDQKSEFELEVDADKPSAIAGNGQTSAIAFNMDLIAAKNPELAEQIRRAYEKAKVISANDKLDGAEEDVALVLEMFKDLPRDS